MYSHSSGRHASPQILDKLTKVGNLLRTNLLRTSILKIHVCTLMLQGLRRFRARKVTMLCKNVLEQSERFLDTRITKYEKSVIHPMLGLVYPRVRSTCSRVECLR